MGEALQGLGAPKAGATPMLVRIVKGAHAWHVCCCTHPVRQAGRQKFGAWFYTFVFMRRLGCRMATQLIQSRTAGYLRSKTLVKEEESGLEPWSVEEPCLLCRTRLPPGCRAQAGMHSLSCPRCVPEDSGSRTSQPDFQT